MMEFEHHMGFLIRYRLDGNALILVLEDFQDGFPPALAEEVREITIKCVNATEIDNEGLKNSQGDDFWLTIMDNFVEIGANFMPEHKVTSSSVVVSKRSHDTDDLKALYVLLRSALITYQKDYALECRKTADFHNKIAKFIATRHDRLRAKVDFFADKDPIKAAGFRGMLSLLDELGNEFKR